MFCKIILLKLYKYFYSFHELRIKIIKNKNMEQPLKENYFVSYAVRGPTNPATGIQNDMPVGLNPYPRYSTSCMTWNDLNYNPECQKRIISSEGIVRIPPSVAGVT